MSSQAQAVEFYINLAPAHGRMELDVEHFTAWLKSSGTMEDRELYEDEEFDLGEWLNDDSLQAYLDEHELHDSITIHLPEVDWFMGDTVSEIELI